MDSSYDIVLLKNYNIKFDQNKYLCDSIYNNLTKIFEWNQQTHYKMHQRLSNMKNMENLSCIIHMEVMKLKDLMFFVYWGSPVMYRERLAPVELHQMIGRNGCG